MTARTAQLNACADFLANVPDYIRPMTHTDRRDCLIRSGGTLDKLAGGNVSLADCMKLAGIAAEKLPMDESGLVAKRWRDVGLLDLSDALDAIRADEQDDLYRSPAALAEAELPVSADVVKLAAAAGWDATCS
jgi:hypothetical protein